MCKWTLTENAQKLTNDEIEKLGIYKIPDKHLFHYTSREAFWKIIEDETMLARHIMFSNDYEENKIGTQKIEEGMKQIKGEVKEADALPFMVCFCEEEDLLSQWRGYANEGIALEFDFSKGMHGLKDGFSTYQCFTVMNNDTYKNIDEFLSEFTVLKDGKKEKEKVFVGAVASPYHVIYTERDEKVDGSILANLVKIKENAEESSQMYAIGMIPYIKEAHFKEENEYRLIFDMNLLLQNFQRQIMEQKYIYLDDNGIRKPNIKVKFGNQLDGQKETTSIYYVNKDFTDVLTELKDKLAKESIVLELVNEPYKYKMEEQEVIISNSKFQEEICILLRQIVRQKTPAIENIKIWCDGHLPIRRIIVGPSKSAELMQDSIREYIKTRYWMRDIEVDISKIPLRT